LVSSVRAAVRPRVEKSASRGSAELLQGRVDQIFLGVARVAAGVEQQHPGQRADLHRLARSSAAT
jgi:hypothetical protein